MLAQSFKPAAELGLSEAQREALIKTLVLLETKKLTHVTNIGLARPNKGTEFTGHFNMHYWKIGTECGTICCIGGTTELIGNVSFYNAPKGLNDLFIPIDYNMWQITPAQAAVALRNYLTCGEAKWDEVLG